MYQDDWRTQLEKEIDDEELERKLRRKLEDMKTDYRVAEQKGWWGRHTLHLRMKLYDLLGGYDR